MIEKNKEYIVDIVSAGYEGEGIAKIDSFPIFIPGAIEGEKTKIKIIKLNKNYAFGKLIDIITPSKDRVEPLCEIYSKCGGCNLQHMSYESQLEFKTKRVKDCIERIGKIKDATIHNTIGSASPYRYRNKVQLPVGGEKGDVKIGFYAQRSHNIIDMKKCIIQDESGDKAVDITRQWMNKYGIEPYNEIESKASNLKGVVRHIMVRKGFKTNEVMVVLVTTTKEVPYKEEFIKLIRDNIDGVKSIIQNINPKLTNVVLGEENIVLFGEDHISDYIDQFKFKISPLSFFQVNPIQTEILYKKALEYADLKGDEIVFDAYCGTGTISLFLSQKAKKVYGVEIVKEAIENAKENAKLNGINNTEFIVGQSETVIPELIEKGIKAEVVVVDPPRKGCAKELLEAIAHMSPKRIVYVSCDPSTLARDLAILEEMGYKAKEVQPVDMFSETSHVESIILMTYCGSGGEK
ncbi:23S rRNA (uracil(1939)-C(5))-methyltransferase RlmD [Clostridium algidicarnis]|uniref:23S rRNA (uracil(1939)-C(5))-methyltransferase RlmD n=1 Tax=Clostridium algidicarnis TaxID=37659 RepID=UPI001CF1E42D|nr:23S rRNA (uracil(1939)-C(5))-methyltransferase RlmD [Clostridium algidicarnis]MCB2286386.1 23S rRNA (uracil(1939)-C(5))-methyltransferase RlmD [Clostridium algidicarnis]